MLADRPLQTQKFQKDSRSAPGKAARGDDSLAQHGVISAGSKSGSQVRLNGTSDACPQIARLATWDIAEWDDGRDWAKHTAQDTYHRFKLRGHDSTK